MRVQQKPRAFDRVAGHADGARRLALVVAVLVGIDDAGHLAAVVMLDRQHMGALAHLEPAGCLALRDLGIGGRPLGAELAALEAKADLLAGWPAVALLAVDRHPAGVDLGVAELPGAGLQHLIVVVAGQAGDAVGPGRPHLVLGLVVPGRHLGAVDRPVEQVRPGNVAIGRAGLPLVVLEPERRPGPVYGRATDRLDDPGGQAGEILRHPPGARGRPRVGPGELAEARPFVVDVVAGQVAPARLERDHVDTLLRELVRQRSAAGAGADHHHHAAVIQVIRRSHVSVLPLSAHSHAMSSKPRAI